MAEKRCDTCRFGECETVSIFDISAFQTMPGPPPDVTRIRCRWGPPAVISTSNGKTPHMYEWPLMEPADYCHRWEHSDGE